MADLSDKGRKLIDLAMANDEPSPIDDSWGTLVSRLTGEAPGDAMPSVQGNTSTLARRHAIAIVVSIAIVIGFAWWWSQRPDTASAPVPAATRPIAPASTDVPAKVVTDVVPVHELLPAAEAALAADDPERAMALLQQHVERAPTDPAAPHRMALRVLTLCAQHQPERARDEAKAFLAAHGDTQWADVVRRSCAVGRDHSR